MNGRWYPFVLLSLCWWATFVGDGWAQDSQGFGLSGLMGTVTVEGAQWQRLDFQPHLRFGALEAVLDLELFLDEQGRFRDRGWDFSTRRNTVGSLLRKIYYVRYGDLENPERRIYFRVGALESVTLGHGLIMWRYRNTLDSPGLKKTGFDVKILGQGDRMFTFRGVVSDFADFDGGGPVVGGRVAWAMGGLEVGGTVVMDTDQLSAVPDSVRVGLSRDPFGAFGVDAAFPLLKGPSLTAAIYGGASRSVKGDGGGTALSGPGIKLNVAGATVQAEYRWVEGRFIPGYFDALYERNRAVVDPVTGQVTTREATLTDLSMRGFFGHAEVSLGPLLQAEASYQYLDTEGSGDHRIQGRASLKQALLRHLRKVSKAEAYYENHRRGASHHGLFDATSETRFGYRLVVEPLPRLSILWEVQFTYEPDEAGGFERRRLLNLQSIIRL